ncbi:PREDICTED: mast cell carboxypeptidase A-like [Gekko japonicus]|uniref:Mast cell carboxypeptidase A-like n=1 Tax=Gekko japonicus TaxID=146911 RepID=A0ABM1LCF2_GEKJA|nr:PREDICTED: mast cell carboxypeptidase A-like [Gekko japonicus]
MKFLVFFLGLLVRPQAVSLARRFDSEKVFRVTPQNETQVNFLKELASAVQLDFWHPDSVHHIVAGTDVDFQVSSYLANHVQMKLEQNELQYEILFHNLQEEIEKQFKGKSYFLKKHSYLKYNDWDKIVAWTERIARNNPKMVSRIEIGKTYEGRPMYLLKVGKETGRKRVIFIECGTHAREWISPAFCQWFVKQATSTYGKDKEMTKLLDSMNFYVLPVFNIDGYVWTWTENRMWRKNRSNNSNSDCIGTDLNRNFKVAWGTESSSDDPCDEIYCGSSAESEQETKEIANFIRDHLAVIRGYISFHSYSQMLMFPYGYTYKMAPNHVELVNLIMGSSPGFSKMYKLNPASGASLDWAYDEGIKHAYVFELRDHGRYGFMLPESKIRPTCKETMLAVKYIASHILASAP